MTDEHRCKYHQQNFSKQNSVTHQKAHIPWSSWVYSRNAKILQYMQIMWYTILTNWRIKIMWSSQQMQKKPLTKMQHPFVIKTFQKMGIEGTYLNIVKAIYDSLVQFSHSVVSDSLWPHEPQHTRHPCPISTPRVYPNSCPLSQWCHLNISSSVLLFSSFLQFSPTSGYFQMTQLFSSGGQNSWVSASTSVLPMNTQDWSPLGWTGWIFLQSKGLSRVFSNTTVQKHQFFSPQLSLQSNSHIHTWLLEKP